MLRTNKCSGIFQNHSFPIPMMRAWGYFCVNINCEKLVGFQKVKLTKCWGLSPPRLAFVSQICPQWASSNLLTTFRFSCLGTSSMDVSALIGCDSPYIQSLPFGGQWLALWPYLSCAVKKSCWCFIFFSLFLVGMEWLPSSITPVQELETLKILLKKLIC